MNGIDLIVGVLVRPLDICQTIKNREFLLVSKTIFSLAILSCIIACYVVTGITLTWQDLFIQISLWWIVSMFVWSFFAACIHFVAEMAGGSGKVTALYNLYGLSTVPLLLVIPISLIIMFIGYQPIWISLLCITVLLVWVIILQTRFISCHYALGIIRSLFVAASPFALINIIIILFVTVIAASIFSISAHFFH